MTDTYCGECNEPINDEDTLSRKPCPKCGSKNRIYDAKVSTTVSVSASATCRVFRPASAFLDIARKLASSSERMDWNLAIVAAVVSCEIASEKAIVEAARHTNQEHLVSKARSGDKTFKMHHKATQKLYRQLTGDDITKPSPDWDDYEKIVDWRNDVVHEGEQKSQAEATECVQIAAKFVDRLGKNTPSP